VTIEEKREKVRMASRKRRADHPELCRNEAKLSMRKWRANNPDYYKTDAWKAYQAKWSRDWRAAHPGEDARKQRKNNLFRTCKRYGLLVEEYNAIAERGCEICGEKPKGGTGRHNRLYVDHDHQTGAFRGLLCFACNLAIGRFDKAKHVLANAVRYLETVPRILHE